MKTTRHLATAALALGLLAVPTAAGAATGYATSRPTPPPPVGADDLAVPLPDLTVEAFDVLEGDGALAGRLTLSAPLTTDLTVAVTPVLIDIDPWDHGCLDPGDGSCGSDERVEIPAGATQADVEISVWTDDGAEPAERYGFAIDADEDRVDVGPQAEAVLYDGDGLDLRFAEDQPEGDEGDPGADGTLDLVVTADQALPHPVTFRVHSGAAGGYNAALPGVDFTPIDVVAELPAGETELTVPLPLVGDDLDERPYELVYAYLSDPSHGEVPLGDGTSLARIIDDDRPVVAWKTPGGYQSSSRSARSAALTA